MIRFGEMVVEGFASIGEEVFDWGVEGLNIIQAPNGYGKTKFINALVWCIYGKTLSGSVEPWPHVRRSSYCGTRVGLNIYIGLEEISITRYKDYTRFKNSLILRINDGDPEEGEKKDIQKKIEKIIGYSYDLFKNSIIFGQKLKRLISESGPNKKKVFDDAFEVTYIPKAKKIAEEKLREYKDEERENQNSLNILEEKIRGKEAEISAEQNMVGNFEGDKKKRVKVLRGYLKDRKTELKMFFIHQNDDELNNRIYELGLEKEIFEKDLPSAQDFMDLTTKKVGLDKDIENSKEDKEDIRLSIERFEKQIKNVPDSCGTCGRPFTKDDKRQEKRRLKKELRIEQKEYQEKINSIGTLKGQLQEIVNDLSSAYNCKEGYDNACKILEGLEDKKKTLLELQKSVEDVKVEIEKEKAKVLKNNIEILTRELSDLQIKAKQKKKYLNRVKRDVRTYEWLVKDPLSNSGLKAFIFNMMLDDINERLDFYTKFVGFQVAFFMDMKSANKDLETYVFQGEEPVPYEDLSGGQQQAVDIATAFAIHDVVSDTKDCKLLVMDEVFESLDKDNIEIMAELIQDKAQNKCLYLVTHRAEFNPTNANIIGVDFTNGITSLS